MDKEARRLQVLDCAREVFAERGYHQTKIEDIVTRAGIARGTFYLYFQDKRAVFQELLKDFFSTLQQSITRIDVSRDVTSQVRQNVYLSAMGSLRAEPSAPIEPPGGQPVKVQRFS